MSLRQLLSVIGGLLIAASFYVALSFDSPLTLDVYPRAAIGRTDMKILTRVWPSDLNRELLIDVDSADGDSYITGGTLNGSHEPVQHNYYYRGVGPGEYAIRACLRRTDRIVCQMTTAEVRP